MQVDTYPQTALQLPAGEPIDTGIPTATILDIRQEKVEVSLQSTIHNMLKVGESTPMRLPFELLYNAKGLHIFEEITYLEDYYPTNNELEILEKSADQLAQNLLEGSIIVELGSGYVNLDYNVKVF